MKIVKCSVCGRRIETDGTRILVPICCGCYDLANDETAEIRTMADDEEV